MHEAAISRRELLRLGGVGLFASGRSLRPQPDSEGALLAFASLGEAAERIRSGDVSPVELTELILERIGRLDGRLKSYATLMPDEALASARLASVR